MPDESGPEPTGWELMRGLRRIEESLSSLGQKVVPLDLYMRDREHTQQEMKSMAGKVAHLEQSMDAERDQRAKEEADRRKASDEQASRNRLFWLGIGLGPIVGAVVAWVVGGGLIR